MIKPYIFWDVSSNADLWKRTAQGPLVVSISDEATESELMAVKKLIAQTTIPILFDDEETAYQQSVYYEQEDASRKGIKVSQQPYMPNNLEFGFPGPDPYDDSIAYGGHQFKFLNVGYQLMVRGWAGTMQEGSLNGEFIISWTDETSREFFDTRGECLRTRQNPSASSPARHRSSRGANGLAFL